MTEDRGQGKRSRFALFLDFDGTLAPIAPHPDLVHLGPHELDLLDSLGRLLPLFVISGRAFPDILRRLPVSSLAGLSGDHGAVRRFREKHTVHPEALRARDSLAAWVPDLRKVTDPVPGTVTEIKEYSLSVHYRGVEPERVPRLSEEIERLFEDWEERNRFRFYHGKMVWEVRPAGGVTKEETMDFFLEHLAREAGVEPRDFFPVMVGDDTTDLGAVNHAVHLGGLGYWVGNPPPGLDPGAGRLRNTDSVWDLLKGLNVALEAGKNPLEVLTRPLTTRE